MSEQAAICNGAVRVTVPIRIVSEANVREHWAAKHRRAKTQRGAVNLMLAPFDSPGVPCTVTLTRIAPRDLDGDNLQRGFKAVRDEVAAWIGVDDRDRRVTWLYDQQRGRPREYAFSVEVRHGQ